MGDLRFFGLLFLFGGAAYIILECVWRGRSHWTMGLAGGLSLVLLYGVFGWMGELSLLLKCLAGAIVIAAVEFVTGAIVNRKLHWGVWDYSGHRYHLYGQVSLTYTILWGLLCIPLVYFLEAVSILR